MSGSQPCHSLMIGLEILPNRSGVIGQMSEGDVMAHSLSSKNSLKRRKPAIQHKRNWKC